MSRYRRRGLGDDFGYVPGEQPDDAGGWLKLNTNESPLPPSPRVGAAMAAAAPMLHRYPDARAEPLRSLLALRHGVAPEQVMVGNGADQVLDACMRAWCDPGDRAVWPWPTYSLLPVLATLNGVTGVPLALTADWLPPAALGSEPGRLRVLVNPNSPTGRWLPPPAVEELLGVAAGVVVVDEAYCDFAPASCIPLLSRHERWVVVRTLSKSHALAGLRVGYAIGSPDLIADLEAVKDSYPVDRAAIAGAVAALEDVEHSRRIVDTVRTERGRLAAALAERGFTVVPSEANFVLVRPPDGDADAVARRLREHRILVRRLATTPEHLRVTVGDRAAVDAVVAALSPAPAAVGD